MIRVRAGILVHILFISCLFLLILDFYLFTVVSSQKKLNSQRERLEAELILKLTKDKLKNTKNSNGKFYFTNARVEYTRENNSYKVGINMENTQSVYEFTVANY